MTTTPAITDRSDGNDGAAGRQTIDFEKYTDIEFERRTEMGETTDGARVRSAHRAPDTDRLTASIGPPRVLPAASDGVFGGASVASVTAGSNAR